MKEEPTNAEKPVPKEEEPNVEEIPKQNKASEVKEAPQQNDPPKQNDEPTQDAPKQKEASEGGEAEVDAFSKLVEKAQETKKVWWDNPRYLVQPAASPPPEPPDTRSSNQKIYDQRFREATRVPGGGNFPDPDK